MWRYLILMTTVITFNSAQQHSVLKSSSVRGNSFDVGPPAGTIAKVVGNSGESAIRGRIKKEIKLFNAANSDLTRAALLMRALQGVNSGITKIPDTHTHATNAKLGISRLSNFNHNNEIGLAADADKIATLSGLNGVDEDIIAAAAALSSLKQKNDGTVTGSKASPMITDTILASLGLSHQGDGIRSAEAAIKTRSPVAQLEHKHGILNMVDIKGDDRNSDLLSLRRSDISVNDDDDDDDDDESIDIVDFTDIGNNDDDDNLLAAIFDDSRSPTIGRSRLEDDMDNDDVKSTLVAAARKDMIGHSRLQNDIGDNIPVKVAMSPIARIVSQSSGLDVVQFGNSNTGAIAEAAASIINSDTADRRPLHALNMDSTLRDAVSPGTSLDLFFKQLGDGTGAIGPADSRHAGRATLGRRHIIRRVSDNTIAPPVKSKLKVAGTSNTGLAALGISQLIRRATDNTLESVVPDENKMKVADTNTVGSSLLDSRQLIKRVIGNTRDSVVPVKSKLKGADANTFGSASLNRMQLIRRVIGNTIDSAAPVESKLLADTHTVGPAMIDRMQLIKRVTGNTVDSAASVESKLKAVGANTVGSASVDSRQLIRRVFESAIVPTAHVKRKLKAAEASNTGSAVLGIRQLMRRVTDNTLVSALPDESKLKVADAAIVRTATLGKRDLIRGVTGNTIASAAHVKSQRKAADAKTVGSATLDRMQLTRRVTGNTMDSVAPVKSKLKVGSSTFGRSKQTRRVTDNNLVSTATAKSELHAKFGTADASTAGFGTLMESNLKDRFSDFPDSSKTVRMPVAIDFQLHKVNLNGINPGAGKSSPTASPAAPVTRRRKKRISAITSNTMTAATPVGNKHKGRVSGFLDGSNTIPVARRFRTDKVALSGPNLRGRRPFPSLTRTVTAVNFDDTDTRRPKQRQFDVKLTALANEGLNLKPLGQTSSVIAKAAATALDTGVVSVAQPGRKRPPTRAANNLNFIKSKTRNVEVLSPRMTSVVAAARTTASRAAQISAKRSTHIRDLTDNTVETKRNTRAGDVLQIKPAIVAVPTIATIATGVQAGKKESSGRVKGITRTSVAARKEMSRFGLDTSDKKVHVVGSELRNNLFRPLMKTPPSFVTLQPTLTPTITKRRSHKPRSSVRVTPKTDNKSSSRARLRLSRIQVRRKQLASVPSRTSLRVPEKVEGKAPSVSRLRPIRVQVPRNVPDIRVRSKTGVQLPSVSGSAQHQKQMPQSGPVDFQQRSSLRMSAIKVQPPSRSRSVPNRIQRRISPVDIPGNRDPPPGSAFETRFVVGFAGISDAGDGLKTTGLVQGESLSSISSQRAALDGSSARNQRRRSGTSNIPAREQRESTARGLPTAGFEAPSQRRTPSDRVGTRLQTRPFTNDFKTPSRRRPPTEIIRTPSQRRTPTDRFQTFPRRRPPTVDTGTPSRMRSPTGRLGTSSRRRPPSGRRPPTNAESLGTPSRRRLPVDNLRILSERSPSQRRTLQTLPRRRPPTVDIGTHSRRRLPTNRFGTSPRRRPPAGRRPPINAGRLSTPSHRRSPVDNFRTLSERSPSQRRTPTDRFQTLSQRRPPTVHNGTPSLGTSSRRRQPSGRRPSINADRLRTPSRRRSPVDNFRTPSQRRPSSVRFGTPSRRRSSANRFGPSSRQRPSIHRFGTSSVRRQPSSEFGTPLQRRPPTDGFGAHSQRRQPNVEFGTRTQRMRATDALEAPQDRRQPTNRFGTPSRQRQPINRFGTLLFRRPPTNEFGTSLRRGPPINVLGAPSRRRPPIVGFGTPSRRRQPTDASGTSSQRRLHARGIRTSSRTDSSAMLIPDSRFSGNQPTVRVQTPLARDLIMRSTSRRFMSPRTGIGPHRVAFRQTSLPFFQPGIRFGAF